jgi:hypothetical protein
MPWSVNLESSQKKQDLSATNLSKRQITTDENHLREKPLSCQPSHQVLLSRVSRSIEDTNSLKSIGKQGSKEIGQAARPFPRSSRGFLNGGPKRKKLNLERINKLQFEMEFKIN